MKSLILIVIVFCSCNVYSFSKGKGRHFALYDAMHFGNKPNLEAEGLKPIILLYEHTLTKPDPNNPGKVILDSAKVTDQAKKAAQTPEVVVSTDIEQWYGDTSVSDKEMADRLKVLFGLFKKENSNLKIGNYGTAPSNLNVFRFYDRNKTPDSLLIPKWRASNEKRFASLKYADIIFPSLYIPEPNIKSWEKDFITTIKEIKLRDNKKPVLVYLWPIYYNAPWSEYNGVIVSPDLWKAILETAYKYADGAIIWSSKLDKDKKVIYWTDPKVQEIWRVTKEFIKEKKL